MFFKPSRMRCRRKKLGLTQQQVAIAVGAREGDIRRWEKPGGVPHANTVPAIAAALETSTDWLYGSPIDPDVRAFPVPTSPAPDTAEPAGSRPARRAKRSST